MFLHGKNQLEKGFSTFILSLRFVHVFKNPHVASLLLAIICIFLHPVAEAQVVEVELMWDEPSSSFKVDGIKVAKYVHVSSAMNDVDIASFGALLRI